jgi:hypothetical protein
VKAARRAKSRSNGHTDGHRWDKVFYLIQYIYETGKMPTELPWSVLVVIPNSSGGYRGIGLLEIIWNMISSII